MDHDLIIRPEAESELAYAYAWYEDKAPELGAELLNSIEASLFAIKRSPEMFPTVHGPIKRALIRRFPYAVFFTEGNSRIVVLAVFHVRRDPAQWKNRVE